MVLNSIDNLIIWVDLQLDEIVLGVLSFSITENKTLNIKSLEYHARLSRLFWSKRCLVFLI